MKNMPSTLNRRDFIQFLGKLGLTGIAYTQIPFAIGCRPLDADFIVPFTSLDHTELDDVVLAEGFDYSILIKWKDPITDQDSFGFNNDYIAFIPTDPDNPDEGILWVNHEAPKPLFVSNYDYVSEKTLEQIELERYSVGGSILKIKKASNGQWELVQNDPLNRRLTARTKIPFNWNEPIAGSNVAEGTMANCSGGITPWGTILSAEENYHDYYGETDYAKAGKPRIPSAYKWETHIDNPPEHYGWIVEVDPLTGEAQKHIALGRCAHECATIHECEDGRIVIYTGDDSEDQCLYKFISGEPGSIQNGTLYVANLEKGEWISLNYDEQAILQHNFESQTEVLIRLRESAALVGGTPLDRPEDIEIDPATNAVFIALTNNKPKENYHGSILKIMEDDEDKLGLTFTHDTFLAGGEETGFSCPDNLAFDAAGNLWFTSDISGSSMGEGVYEIFKNNGLFLVPRSGKQAGQVFQVASAPVGAEFTGPFFSPDGETLFLSVQHPGETSESLDELTSHWPEGGTSIPKPAVIAIQGEALRLITNKHAS